LKIKVVEYGLNDAIKDIERLRDEAGRILISELTRLHKIEAAADAIFDAYHKHGECDVVGAELNRAMDAYGELEGK